jgi:mannose-6-phosphate isomerase-like protein (cupin superfamily)
MSDYQVLEMGGLDQWRGHYGGFRPQTSREGRRVVDHDLEMTYIGMTANSFEPVEELYVFLAGFGQMGLNDVVVDVGPGTVVRVGPGVWRTWRAMPDTPEQLRWLCIRAGGYELPHLPDDSTRDEERPSPWTE